MSVGYGIRREGEEEARGGADSSLTYLHSQCIDVVCMCQCSG